MNKDFYLSIDKQINEIKEAGLYKSERAITTSQSAHINTQTHQDLINLCANNYLGLANDKNLIETAKTYLDRYGFGMASVRFICGTQNIHKDLEQRLSQFLEQEDVILYSSCFDANTGLFETILTAEDAIISDSLNHASIIDGVRLCKAKRYRYDNNNMAALEEKLKQADEDNARYKLIVTDGVFSMDGIIADLASICDLADKYHALVMVDDSHAVGFMGEHGKGTHEYCDVIDRVDIVTGTLGKALGGASGGYVAANKQVIELLRQRSRPYLFSNSLAPVIVGTTMAALDIVENEGQRRQVLKDNMNYFRSEMEKAGFSLKGADHAIVPVMIHDAAKAQMFADKLLDEGIYVIGFSYPVVAKDEARIRTQLSAAHTKEQLQKAVAAFKKVAKELNLSGIH